MDGALSFELPNPELFWGTVVSDSYFDNGFILLNIMRVYFTNAVVSVYVFDSSFQSQLDMF